MTPSLASLRSLVQEFRGRAETARQVTRTGAAGRKGRGMKPKRTGIFGDTLQVRTSALGTQSVRPIDILFPDSMMPELLEEARRKQGQSALGAFGKMAKKAGQEPKRLSVEQGRERLNELFGRPSQSGRAKGER